MKIKFKKLHPDAKLPVKKHENDYCFDCYATSVKEVAPNVYMYGLGFAIEMEPENDFEKSFNYYSLDMRCRSSIWKTGMILSDTTGTIDFDYRGEIHMVFYHVVPELPIYPLGERICQCKVGLSVPIHWEEVDELSETARGTGGYGSTGKK